MAAEFPSFDVDFQQHDWIWDAYDDTVTKSQVIEVTTRNKSDRIHNNTKKRHNPYIKGWLGFHSDGVLSLGIQSPWTCPLFSYMSVYYINKYEQTTAADV